MDPAVQGAMVGAGAALLSAYAQHRWSDRQARESAARQAQENEQGRVFAAREARHKDRLDAYLAFATTMSNEIVAEERYERDTGVSREENAEPFQKEPPAQFTRAEEQLTRIEILAPALHPAARAYLDAYYSRWRPEAFGSSGTNEALSQARQAFLRAGQEALGLT